MKCHLMQKAVFLSLLLAGIFAAFPQTYTPPPNSPLAKHEHPRLFFTKESLQTVKEYIDKYEAVDFQIFINEVDTVMNVDPASKDVNFLLFDANNFSFLSYAASSGMFSNYHFDFGAEQYAQKAYDHAVEIDRRRRLKKDRIKEQAHGAIFKSPDQGGYINLTLGAVYDWCYDYLSLSQKQFIADALIYSYQKRDDDVDPGSKVKLGLTLTSQCHNVGVGGLALWGDPLGSEYTGIVQEMLDGIQWLWFDRILLMGEHLFEGTAGWGEGANYFGGAATTVTWFTAAISTATGENLIHKMNWLHDIPKYLYFYVFPMYIRGEKSGFFEQRNDTIGLREWISHGTLQRIAAIAGLIKSEDPDYAGFYRWILEDSEFKITEVRFEDENPRLYWLFYKFLWGFKDVEKKTPEEVGLQKSYRFGLGDVILKSDLHTQNATKINFYTPKYMLRRHYHKDNGSFVIFKYGNLALDAGISKSSGDLPKTDRTGTPIYHNLLALYDPNRSNVYDYDLNSTDRADAYYDADNQPGGRNHMGNVEALRFEPDIFDYVDYDYTRSYKGEDYVTRIRRKLLYIRDPHAPNYSNQEYLLIFDDVEVTDPAIKRRWLLHTPSAPEIVDGSWNQEKSGFWTSTEGSIIKVSSTYANTHGRMFVKVLSPASYQLRLRGGSEGNTHYWFTDAEGNDLTKRGPFNPWGAFWVGSHRLEIEDTSEDKFSQYLTVLQIGDANTLSSMATVEKIDNDDYMGAFINGDRVALINKTESLANFVVYSIKTQKTVWHIITGLNSGKYAIKKDGTRIDRLEAGEDGTIYFRHTGGGEFVIERGN